MSNNKSHLIGFRTSTEGKSRGRLYMTQAALLCIDSEAIGSARPLIGSVRPLILKKTCTGQQMDKVWNIFWGIATILYFGDWDRRFLQSMISRQSNIALLSLLLAPCQSLLVLRSHDVPLSIKFFSFALLKLSRFRSNPLASGNCLKVSVMKGNFTWNMNFTFKL